MSMYHRKRHKEKVIYKYDCSITGKSYKRTEKAANPEELMSVDAYYQLNADKDDRPAVVKKKLGVGAVIAPTTETPTN